MFGHFLWISALAILLYTLTGNKYHRACEAVESAISNGSRVYYPGDPLYKKGNYHYFLSNVENPACVAEPGTPEDVGKILNVIGVTKTPFAVKSGGHGVNPGSSSTKGILIYTGRFSQVTYDAASGTAVIGSGLTWDNVYERLRDHNVTVIGGRVSGVGVGGLVLGGGYSYKTNQYGLSIDSTVGFNLVLPNGMVTYVTKSTHPDLFFGLKGGFNNFGIVTDFTMKTYPQAEVWGGLMVYSSVEFDKVRAAITDFSVYCRDPKAAIVPSYFSSAGYQGIAHVMFYDGPTAPPSSFDNFTNIPFVASDVKTRSYSDFVSAFPTDSTAGLRGSWQMLAVSYFSEALLKAIEDELRHWDTKLSPKDTKATFYYFMEPFLPDYLSHANSPSAFPAPAARQLDMAPNPLVVYFGWGNALNDDEFVAAVEESTNRLSLIAKAEGLLADNPPTLYGNYVNSKTPLVDIYGDNLPHLRTLKAKVDPTNVMGLAGGFKI